MLKYVVKAHTSFVGFTGYNRHSQDFFTALNKYIPVRIRNYSYDPRFKPTEEHKSMLVEQTLRDKNNNQNTHPFYSSYNDSDKKEINIVLNESNHHYFKEHYDSPKIAYNVWETTRQCDNCFHDFLQYDQLWVPSEWQRQCSIEQGYPEDRVKVVPEAVDGNIFRPLKKQYNYKEHPLNEYHDGRFKFLLFGRWDYRKCIREIIETFLKTFNKDEKIDLIALVDNPWSIDELNSTEERLKVHGLDDERIKVKHFLSDKDYLTHLRTGHAFVSCARGEGWNRPLAEAIACGIPSISSNYGAQLEFTSNSPHLVDIKGERPAMEGSDESFVKNWVGNFCEPDFNHLSKVFRNVYENYKEYKEVAIKSSIEIRENFSLDNAAKIAYSFMEELVDKEVKPVQSKVELIEKDLSQTITKLSILITINHLNSFRGSELFTYTLAERLVNEGHKVTIYTPDDDPKKDNNDTRFIDMFEDIGVSIFYDTNSLYNRKFDVIHIQHNSTVKAVYKLFPDTPKVFFSHGVLPELEQPPISFKIDKYIACSEEIKKNLEYKGCKNVSIIRNLIDTKIFNPGNISLNDTCKKALVISNYIKEIQKNVIIESCEKLNIEVKFIGGTNKLTPNELALEIQQVDIVFSLGRGIMESMLCGRIPIVYDYNGGDGIVIPDNIEYLMKKNFSGRTNKIFYNVPKLIKVIKEYKKEYGNILREIALDYFDYTTNTNKIIDIYKQTIDKINGEVFVIGCHANTKEKLELLEKNIKRIKELNIPIVITTHYPIPIEIQQQVDFVLYEKENILSGDNKLRYWFHYPDYVKIVGDCEKGDYQSVAIISLIRNAINFCKSYSYIHYLESDTIINIPKYLTKARKGFKNQKKCIFFNYTDQIGFITNIFSFNIEWFDKIFDKINSWEEYIKVDVDRAESLNRRGNWVFESWIHTLFEAKDLYKDILLLNNRDRDNIILKSNVIDRGKEEPLLRYFLAETNNNKVILFIINGSDNNETLCIYKDNKLHNEQELPQHNVTWSLWDKVNTNFTIKFKSKSILDLNLSINSTKIYYNTSFKFFDNTDIKALDWVWDNSDQPQLENDVVPEIYDIQYNFINGAFMEVKGNSNDKRLYQFDFLSNGVNIYQHKSGINTWTKTDRKYYTDWLIQLKQNNKLIFEHQFDCKGKRVYIAFESSSLGDSIAWVPYVEEFRKKHQCDIICSTFWNNLYQEQYPEIKFIEPNIPVHNLYALYRIGLFDLNVGYESKDRNPRDTRNLPLQEIATDILGLDFKEIVPKITIPDKPRKIKDKYVCISIHSTCQAKYWNYKNGWQKIVDYLNELGYKVVHIDKERNYMGNKAPKRVIDKTGNIPLEDRITDLKYADFFIGLSSGLSWLSWALRTPVIMISGHSTKFFNFKSNMEQVCIENICHGCLHDIRFKFDKGDWNWCPQNKNFECTKSITPKMVIKKISNII